MDLAPLNVGDGRPVFYAGRFADRVPPSGLPAGGVLLGDWDVLPARLAAALEGASALVVTDLFSFPFEALIGVQRDVPLVLVLPPELDAEFLTAVFGPPAFARLGFFDRVATPDDALWDDLRHRYGWAAGQRVEIESADPERAVVEIAALLEAESAPQNFPANGSPAVPRDEARGRASAYEKAVHRAQRAILVPQFAAARGPRAGDVPFDVLEVGAGRGRWAAGFDPAETRFFGVDGEEAIAAARAEFAGVPGTRFDPWGEGLLLPHETEAFDLVFCVTVMHRYPAPEKGRLISEMWRVTKPGGRLLFLEDFVFGEDSRAPGIYPISVQGFVGLLLEATDGQVVLEHFESLRYPGEDLTRGGLLAVSRLGVPKRW